MKNDTITQGEYNALVALRDKSPCGRPKGVQDRTLWNLSFKRLIKSERRQGGHWWYSIKDEGKAAIDAHPHHNHSTSE